MVSHCLFDSEDMIVEIFSRLPVKSLLRFKAISKSYSFLISSPEFIRIHTRQSPSNILITFMQQSKARNISLYGPFYALHTEHQLPLSREIGAEYPFGDFHIIDSCNGIFFLKNRDFRAEEFVLWNPSLGCKLTLPPINHRMNVSGFGYDAITDDYKVLMMSSDFPNQVPSPDPVVYSIKTGAWVAAPPPTKHYPIINSVSCFVNGAMHWLVANLQRHSIMTFDVSAHVFGEIALPDEIKECSNLKLIVIRESLGVVARVMNECGVWMMGEYNNWSTWCLVYEIKCEFWDVELEGCLERNGEILTLFRSIDDPGCQILNGVTGARTKLFDLEVNNIRIDEVETFKESLALLDGGVKCIRFGL